MLLASRTTEDSRDECSKVENRTVKELADMARKKKVHGWHEMRKEDLVRALLERPAKRLPSVRRTTTTTLTARCLQAQPQTGRRLATNGHANGANGKHGPHFKNGANGSNGATRMAQMEKVLTLRTVRQSELNKSVEGWAKAAHAQAELRLQQIKARLAEAKDLAIRSVSNRGPTKDRLVVMVRDPYWLHAYWELSRRSIQRAEAAMGQHWHAARPVLRVHELDSQRHHQCRPAGRSRHRHSRRREQLVHRRAEPAQELPVGNRLFGAR